MIIETKNPSDDNGTQNFLEDDFGGSFSYYAYSKEYTEENNRESSFLPIELNCAGCLKAKSPFTTSKPLGRRDFYLMYVYAGTLSVFDRGTEKEINGGTLLIFEPNKPYAYSYKGGEPLTYFWAHFTGSEAEKRLREYSLTTFPSLHEIRQKSSVINRFRTIFDAFSYNDRFVERELSALTERLLVSVSRSVLAGGERKGALSKSLRFIGANYGTDIKIKALANMEHLSVSRFNFLFKKQTGLSPTKYVIALRMSSAKDLLASTDIPIGQVGIMCGYNDPQFFSKIFKLYVGISPTAFRKGQS